MRKRLLLCVLIIISLFLIGCNNFVGKAFQNQMVGKAYQLTTSGGENCIIKDVEIEGQNHVVSNCQNQCRGGSESVAEFKENNPNVNLEIQENFGADANEGELIICPCMPKKERNLDVQRGVKGKEWKDYTGEAPGAKAAAGPKGARELKGDDRMKAGGATWEGANWKEAQAEAQSLLLTARVDNNLQLKKARYEEEIAKRELNLLTE